MQQKVTKGVDPPSTLTPDMIPPSERSATSGAVSLDVRQLHPLLHLLTALLIEIFTCTCTLRVCVFLLLYAFYMGVLLSDFTALQNSFFCFCFFELISILSTRSTRGLFLLWDLTLLHYLICEEWVVELCVTRWRLCSVIFSVSVWCTKCK